MKKKLLVGLAAAALAVIPASAAFGDAHDTGQVVIVHGVPGFEADILVNGETSDLTGLEFGDVAVVDLPADSYDLGVAPAGSTDAILAATADVEAGVSYTVAAYLDTDGDPTLGLFVNENDVAGIQPFHLANFVPVSIIADGEIVEGFNSVENGQTARIAISGTVPGVGIGAADSNEPVIELGDVEVPEDQLLLVYAIGPDEGEELPSVEVQAIDVAEDHTPEEVPSGSAGLVSTGLPALVVALMLLGAVAMATPAIAARRRR